MREWWKSGTAMVVWIAVGTVVVHLATGWRYGFDRDELMAMEDARHLAWGYVQYPPMTAFLGWAALKLFGTSLVGFRFFAAVAMALAVVLTGLMAKEIARRSQIRRAKFENREESGSRTHGRATNLGEWAMVVAALAGVPFCLGGGALMQYISFDYVCWVVVAYCMVRVLSGGQAGDAEEEDEPRNSKIEIRGGAERWWVGVGAGIGLGMMAKYTMGFLVVGVVAGVLLTGARRYLKSGWLWLGVMVACAMVLPNFLWEWHRHFISLEFYRFLHARDVVTGQTDWFLPGQVRVTLLAFPLALAGICFCLFAEEGERYRVLGWMYVVPLVLFLVMRGRDYYLAPAYPMLYAAGAVWVEKKWRGREERSSKFETRNSITEEITTEGLEDTQRARRLAEGGKAETGRWRMQEAWGRMVRRGIWAALIVDVVVAGAVALPIAPIQSRWWKLAVRVDSVFAEEIGWPEFVETVARVRDGVPMEERARLGILAGNYGEVGALNLYGEKYGLPGAISGVNSSWERGYGTPGPEPETVIVVGYPREFLERHFASCSVAGHTWNRYGVKNEETLEDPDIFVCRGLKESWEEFWKGMKKYA